MKKILIIEDNTDVRENLGELLELSGYISILAPNGKEGIKIAIAQKPDLIICDIMMPEMDGYSVLKVLGKNQMTMNIPFIFLTAKSNHEDFRKGMNLGADDFVTKPFSDVELINAVEVRLKKSERIQSSATSLLATESPNRSFDHRRQTLEQLSMERKTRVYKKKEYLYREKEIPNQLFFIKKGRIKLFKTNDYGKELITSILSKGEFVGYLGLIKNCPYQVTAQALEDSEISIIPKEDFLSLLYGDQDVSRQLIKKMANKIQDKEDRLLRLAYDSVRKRVADALLVIAKKSGASAQESVAFALRREDLASVTGSSKETVIRTLADFKDENLLEIIGGKLVIKNWKALSELPN